MKKVVVIGAGFAGLSAATCLAHKGFDVTVLEKNSSPGGRARMWEKDGFRFDLGPSWYWMPDVFERYFKLFGKEVSAFYSLERLDPSYRIYYAPNDFLDVPAGVDALKEMFERLEPGSGEKLQKFLDESRYKYDLGMNKLVYNPGQSLTEFMDSSLWKGLFRLHVFQSLSSYVRKYFHEPRLIRLLEFPVLFLGSTADRTPALYSLMNYADMSLGTWYPKGGMGKVVQGMTKLAVDKGVRFHFDTAVTGFDFQEGRISAVRGINRSFPCDYVVSAADYHHVDQQLLPKEKRNYSPTYWSKRIMAPSALLYYVGLNCTLNQLPHHSLFFDEDFGAHAAQIYDNPAWPSRPQFYLSHTTATDPSTAPPGHSALVILIPVAPGLEESADTREHYFQMVMRRLEGIIGQSLRPHVVLRRDYAHREFIDDYNAFKGNAYGLANTLGQTANLKPSIQNKNVPNLFYTGQLTVPGPGVPPAIISGQVVAGVVHRVQQQEVAVVG